jgi:hypothetical protein
MDELIKYMSLAYPELPGNINTIEIDLVSVRAADGLRISYDFVRDGWVIKQARFFAWDTHDAIQDGGWVEVAFIYTWGSVDHEDYKRVTGQEF